MKRINLNLRSFSLLSILFIGVLIIVTGCKKEEEHQNTSRPDFQATFTTTSPSSLTPNLTNNLMQNSFDSYLHLNSIESKIMSASSWVNILQYMPGLQEENGNSLRMPSPAPPTWTWSMPPYTITFTYNQTSSQYVYSYTINYNGCLYYDMNGWENTNGTAGHWEQNIVPSCIGGSTLSPYLQTLDWQHSSGIYDMQFTYDVFGLMSEHFDYQINTNNGSGNYYMYSFTSPASFSSFIVVDGVTIPSGSSLTSLNVSCANKPICSPCAGASFHVYLCILILSSMFPQSPASPKSFFIVWSDVVWKLTLFPPVPRILPIVVLSPLRNKTQ